jgi:hypothetical protein
MPRLLSPLANPIWFETVSHKLLRLAGPWLAGVVFAGSALGSLRSRTPLTAPVRMALCALLAAQLVGLAAAALGSRVGAAGRLARTFVVLNAAALVGLWRFLRGTQRVTW